MQQVRIVGAKRTPIGAFNGFMKNLPAVDLGALAIRSAGEGLGWEKEETPAAVFVGNVLSAGEGQNPARQAALGAGLSPHCTTITVNHVCASGMTAFVQAFRQLQCGAGEWAVAAGMENMSRAPYLMPQARGGYRYGHGALVDHLLKDGLEDAYFHRSMLQLADQATQFWGISREELEDYAAHSFENAQVAVQNGYFDAEMIPVLSEEKRVGDATTLRHDEPLHKVDPARFARLPTVLPGGVLTAATSSPISDGAAALVLVTDRAAQKRGWTPLATVVGCSYAGRLPEHFIRAPVDAITRLLEQTGWLLEDVDLFEVNEAFASVPLLVHRDLGVPLAKVNICGGACSLGHPLGCSGARILVTLLHAMRRTGARRGIASVCVGGGESAAVALEMV